MNLAKIIGLTAEEATSLCHAVGVGAAAAMTVSSLVTGWIAFFHNLHNGPHDVVASGWDPTLTLVGLVGALIGGGVAIDRLNTPMPEAGKNGEPK